MDISSSVVEGAFATSGSPAHFRLRRHKREARRARANLHLLLAASGGSVRFRGADPIVSSLAANCQFAPHDLIIVRVTSRKQIVTLVIAPRRIWHSPERRLRLFVLKRRGKHVGRRIMLVPEPQLRKQPRLETAEQIVAATTASISTSERLLLEAFVQSEQRPTLKSCGALIAGNPDPLGAVLLLVSAGRLCVDLSRPITLSTQVWSAAT